MGDKQFRTTWSDDQNVVMNTPWAAAAISRVMVFHEYLLLVFLKV